MTASPADAVSDIPRRAGAPADPNAFARGRAGGVRQGTQVVLWLRTDGARVVDARFEVFGCPDAIASAAWLAEYAVGRASADLERVAGLDIAAELDLPAEKIGVALVVEDALRDALDSIRGAQTSG